MSQIKTKFIENLAITDAKIDNATIDLTTKVTGILPVTNGGTGSSTSTLATRELDNLNTTSINADLLPDSNAGRNLGSDLLMWLVGYIQNLHDSFGIISIAVENRSLKDAAGLESFDYNNRVMKDSAGVDTIQLSGRRLLDITGTVAALDWTSRQLSDSTGEESLDWDLRKLYGNTGFQVLDFTDPSFIELFTNLNPSTADTNVVGDSGGNYFNQMASTNFNVMDSTSGNKTQVSVPVLAGNLTLNLPPDAGTSGYVLRTDGAGVTTWVPNGSATPQMDTITSVANQQTFTLSATPIVNSVHFVVKGGGPTLEGASHDFTVSGTTLTILNDLATGGASPIITGDIVQIKYLS